MIIRFAPNRGQFIALMVALGVAIGVALPLFGLDLGLALALALGFPSFVYASFQFADAADTIGKLTALERTLQRRTRHLEEQLSTRRLSNAPRFMADISQMLGKAKREVLICCDFPAYGSVSAPSEYSGYVKAIGRLRRNVTVKLLVLDRDARKRIAEEFFEVEANLPVTKSFTGNKDAFLKLIVEKNEQALRDQFSDAQKFETSFLMPLFFWIVDGEAVFSVRRPTESNEVEVGFQTSDSRLVEALKGVFARYTQMGEQFELVERRKSTAIARPGST